MHWNDEEIGYLAMSAGGLELFHRYDIRVMDWKQGNELNSALRFAGSESCASNPTAHVPSIVLLQVLVSFCYKEPHFLFPILNFEHTENFSNNVCW